MAASVSAEARRGTPRGWRAAAGSPARGSRARTSAEIDLAPISRARMTSLRATSMPERSSRGSGSVYPRPLASRTTVGECRAWRRSDGTRTTACPRARPRCGCTRSPVRIRSRSVVITGSPAPTVASYKNCRRVSRTSSLDRAVARRAGPRRRACSASPRGCRARASPGSVGDRVAGGAIDDHRVRQVLGSHVLRERLEVRRRPSASASRQPASLSPASSSTMCRESMMPRTRTSMRKFSRSTGACDSSCDSSAAPTSPGPMMPTEHGLVREVEPRVHGPQRARRVCAIDHRRDVPLGRPLRDGAHVDPRAPSAPKNAAATPGVRAISSPTAARMLHPGTPVDPLDLALARSRPRTPARAVLRASSPCVTRARRSRSSARSWPAR